MKIIAFVAACFVTVWGCFSAFASDQGFWLGTSKASLERQTLEVPRRLWHAMAPFVGPFGKNSRIMLIRDGKCFIINGAKDLDVVRDFPILPGDRIQKYDVNDLKEWNLPEIEGADAVAWLVESEKHRASESKEELEEPQQTVASVKSSLAKFEPPTAPTASAVPVHTATASTEGWTSTWSKLWSIIVVLIVAATGLLSLLLKRRS